MKSKWRTPLYMNGRVATMIRTRQGYGENEGKQYGAAPRIGGTAVTGPRGSDDGARYSTEPQRQHQFRQLQRE